MYKKVQIFTKNIFNTIEEVLCKFNMKINQNRFQLQLDRSAITLSVICAVQCMLLPITAIMLPTFSLLPFSEEVFHSALLFFVIPISAFAMLMGCKKHKSYDVVGYGLIGLFTFDCKCCMGS